MKISMLIITLTAFSVLQGQVDNERLRARIDSLMTAEMFDAKAVGVAIGIVKDGVVWYNKGFGAKKLGTTDPVDSVTNFHLASISKVFVATAIMQLVEQGRIELHKRLVDYVPIKRPKDKRLASVTIQQLLTHTSGFPDVNNYHWARPKNDSLALERYALKKLSHIKLKFDPGTKLRYSNLAFEVLGHVIQAVTKTPFDHFEQEQVLSRAGLSRSSFDYNKIEARNKSFPHIKFLWKVKVSRVYPFNREHGPSSTLNSCTYDMCKWIIEMLKIYADSTGSYRGVLAHKTLRDMWQVKYNEKGTEKIGLTWWLNESPLGMYAAHDGQDRGYLSLLAIYPEQKMGMVVLINGDYAFSMIDIINRISLLIGNKIASTSQTELNVLEGKYREAKEKWTIRFKSQNGILKGFDGKYTFELIPVGKNSFINPDDGASFEFRAPGSDSASVVAFKRFVLKKTK